MSEKKEFKSEVGITLNNRRVMLKRKCEAWEIYDEADAAYQRSVDAHEKAEAALKKWEEENNDL